MGSTRDGKAGQEDCSDVELLERIAEGDGAAFGELATRLGPMVRRVLFRLGLSEAGVEDASQETLIRIWRGSAGFQARASVSSWVYRIAVNEGISVLRSQREHPLGERLVELDAERHWELGHRAQAVRKAVLSLPVHLRSVVVLREYEDLTYRAIADILAVPPGTVMSRLHEARLRLRRELASLI